MTLSLAYFTKNPLEPCFFPEETIEGKWGVQNLPVLTSFQSILSTITHRLTIANAGRFQNPKKVSTSNRSH